MFLALDIRKGYVNLTQEIFVVYFFISFSCDCIGVFFTDFFCSRLTFGTKKKFQQFVWLPNGIRIILVRLCRFYWSQMIEKIRGRPWRRAFLLRQVQKVILFHCLGSFPFSMYISQLMQLRILFFYLLYACESCSSPLIIYWILCLVIT